MKTSIILSSLAAFPVMLHAQKTNREAPKPNIIYILADDLGYGDLSCYGQQKFSTPNIDALAAKGIKFTNHYAGSTVSAPSRASLMTGLHIGHSPIRGNMEEQTPQGSFDSSLPARYQTVAECLKTQAYTTACIGKWGMGGPQTQGHPNNQGFDYFFGYLKQLNAHFYFPQFLWENEQKITLNKEKYSPDLYVEKASDFIRENKDKPFFLYFTATIPHAELVIPDKYLDAYKGKFDEPNPWADGQHYGGQSHPRAAFAAMVSKLDSDVGQITRLLEALGIEKNTLIVFTSDNGPHIEGGADPVFFNSGGGFRGVKRDLYEGGIRVPFVACWPGTITAGSVTDHVAAFWDFLPTVCDISGASIPSQTDGISYLPVLTGKKQKKHPFLYWEFYENKGRQAVRISNWKGVRLQAKGNPEAPIELYDLSADPSESKNVATQYPKIVKKISKIMAQQHVEDSKWPFFNL